MCVVVQEQGFSSVTQSSYICIHGFPCCPGKPTVTHSAIAVHRANHQHCGRWIVVVTVCLFLFFVVGDVAFKPGGPVYNLHSLAAPGDVCPESVIQVVGRHPDTVYYNGWNKSLCHALTCDQQHHIGTKDHPAPIDQSLDKSSCSCFQD